MIATDIQSILEQVARHTLSVTDAERYFLTNQKPPTYGSKTVASWIGLLVVFGIGLFLMHHAWQLLTTYPRPGTYSRQTDETVTHITDNATDKSVWLTWLPLLVFGGPGSLFTYISVLGMLALSRRSAYPSSKIRQQTLVQVYTGEISVQKGTQRLVAYPSVKPKQTGWTWVSGLLIGGLLVTALYFSLLQMGKSWRLLTDGVKTQGKVIGMVRTVKGNKTAPVIQYVVDGHVYDVNGHTYSSPAEYAIGDQVIVVYEPKSPETGAIQSFSEQWMGPLLGLGLSVCFLFIFLFVRVRSIR